MFQNGQQPTFPNPIEDARRTFNIGMLICDIWGTLPEMVWHRCFGERYLEHRAGWGLFALFLFAGLHPHQHQVGPVWMAWLVLVACFAMHRFDIFRRRRSSLGHLHSFYTGWPRLCDQYPQLRELFTKRFIEPIATGIVGLICATFSFPLAQFVIGSAIALAVKTTYEWESDRREALDMADAQWWQESLFDRTDSLSGKR